jgi:phosphoribosyl 1,2-cyclic phosphate phosphodiesterase
MRIRFLGTGTSHGVPVLGCACAVCRSPDPRDERYRSSALIDGDGGEAILVDAGPEFRLQALRAGLQRLDAVLVTHAHADHVHGLDDVRPLTRGKPLPVYASRHDVEEIRHRFSYAFGHGQEGGGKPRLELMTVEEDITVGAMRVVAIPLMHGERRILGYRIGGLAYLTDCSAVPESSMRLLGGLDLLVVDALRIRPHPTHFSIDEALDLARALRPGRVLLTHICHDLSHAQIQAYCDAAALPFPAGPAYDGLEVDLPR